MRQPDLLSRRLRTVTDTLTLEVIDLVPIHGAENGSFSATFLSGSAALPLVISTGAQRSGDHIYRDEAGGSASVDADCSGSDAGGRTFFALVTARVRLS